MPVTRYVAGKPSILWSGMGEQSASSAAFAGILALVAQAQGGARLGKAKPRTLQSGEKPSSGLP